MASYKNRLVMRKAVSDTSTGRLRERRRGTMRHLVSDVALAHLIPQSVALSSLSVAPPSVGALWREDRDFTRTLQDQTALACLSHHFTRMPTSTIIPGFSSPSGFSTAIRTGMRWVTLMKWAEALPAGIKANSERVAAPSWVTLP